MIDKKDQEQVSHENVTGHPTLTKNVQSNFEKHVKTRESNDTAVGKTGLTAIENTNENGNRGVNFIEEQYFKKQMEFKAGKMHQLVTD
jgi:hypothetical protein